MVTITLRDLQFRRRQFGIAVAAAAVVFALTLLLTGISAGFNQEIRTTVRLVGADNWIIPRGIPGPFSAPHQPRRRSVGCRACGARSRWPGSETWRPGPMARTSRSR